MRVKNTCTHPVDLKSGAVLAPGEFGETDADDRALTAGLVTEVPKPAPRPKQPTEKKEAEA